MKIICQKCNKEIKWWQKSVMLENDNYPNEVFFGHKKCFKEKYEK